MTEDFVFGIHGMMEMLKKKKMLFSPFIGRI